MESDDESGISWEEEVPDFLIGNPEGISKWNDFLETKANLEKELLNDEEENLYLFQSGQITEEEYEVKHTTDRKGRLKTLEHEIGILEEQMREFEENITKVKQRRNIESLRPAREAADDAKLMKKFDNAAKKAAKFLDEIRPSDSKVRRGRAGLKYILAAPYGPIPGKNLNIQINHPIIDQPFYEAMTEEAEEEVERRARAKSVLENVDKSHLLNCIESFLESNKYYPDVRPKGGEIKLTFIQRLKIKNRYPILRIPKNVFVQLHLESEFEGEEKDFVESIVRTGKYLYVAPDNIDIDVTDGLNWERVNAKGIGSIVMKLSKAQGKTAKQRLRIAKKYYDRERREEKEEEGFQVPKPIPETKESRKFFDYVLPVSNRLFESLIKGSALSNTELTYCWARLERSEGGILYDRKTVRDKNIRCIFMNGRHLKIQFMITMQYCMDLPPDLRANIDYVFVLRENIIDNIRKLWKFFFGIFPTFASFQEVMLSCTEGYDCMVLDNTSKSSKIEDNIFWYRAKPNRKFRIGSRDAWNYHKKRYDSNHFKKASQASDIGKTRAKSAGIIVKKEQNNLYTQIY